MSQKGGVRQSPSRGFVEGSALAGFRGERPECLQVVMLSRQSNRNPSPRLLGRGLNTAGAPGNEYECELFMWWSPATKAAGVSDLLPGPRVLPLRQ